MEILHTNTFVGRVAADLIEEKFANKFFAVIFCQNSYAEGITGTSHSETILAKDGEGFDSKKDVRAEIKERKANGQFKSKITKKTTHYGNLGVFYSKPEVMSGKELADYIRKDSRPLYPTRMISVNQK